MIRGQDPRADHPAGFRRWRGVRLTITALLLALIALPVVPAAAASPTLTISPKNLSQSTDDRATFTITYRNANGVPQGDIPIQIKVTGANSYSTPVSYVTTSEGELRFSYRGRFRGTDTVTAWVDRVRDGVLDTKDFREISTTATVKWRNQNQAASLTLTPERATPVAGTGIELNVSVKDELGQPVNGVMVRFDVTGVNPASGGTQTDTNGAASFPLHGTKAGTDTITAYADTSKNLVQNDGEPSDTKNVTWIEPGSTSFTLTASNTNPLIDSEETVTATLKDESNHPIPGADVHFVVSGANSENDSDTTDSDGEAALKYTGDEAGIDTVTAFVDFNQNDAQDDDEPSKALTITWSGPSSPLSPSPSPSPAPGSFGPAQPVQARDGCTYFPETRHNLCGGFSSYWNGFGGLAVFGLPLSEEFQENGVTTQYFERARFEWHPGSGPERYDVLLGLVGNTVTAGRSGEAPFQPTSANSNCDFHGPTGHNLCGGFRDYWNNFGGLAVYGMPISEEFAERNPDDGQIYTVQYFERARFEWHPGSWPERYDVLLGRLGAQVLDSEHGVQP